MLMFETFTQMECDDFNSISVVKVIKATRVKSQFIYTPSYHGDDFKDS